MDTNTEEAVEKTALEKAELKAIELTELLKVKVHPIVFKEEEDGPEIIGYIKEPSRNVKLAVLDKAMVAPVSAAAQMLETILIREHSDPRIYSENPEHDKIAIGAAMAAFDLVRFSTNQAKKKN